MKFAPIPGYIYNDFEKMMNIFRLCLNGKTMRDTAESYKLKSEAVNRLLSILGNYMLDCWKETVKQGSTDPAPTSGSFSHGSELRFYFDGIASARKSKEFWITQMDRLQARYDEQIAQEKLSIKPINIAQLGLGSSTVRWLSMSDIYTIEALVGLSDQQFRKLLGIGEVKQKEISKALLKHNLIGYKTKANLEDISNAGWIGRNKDGSLDLIGREGEEKTVQIDGSFTRKQLEVIVAYMKERE